MSEAAHRPMTLDEATEALYRVETFLSLLRDTIGADVKHSLTTADDVTLTSSSREALTYICNDCATLILEAIEGMGSAAKAHTEGLKG